MTSFGSVFSVVPQGTPTDPHSLLRQRARWAASMVKALPKGVLR